MKQSLDGIKKIKLAPKASSKIFKPVSLKLDGVVLKAFPKPKPKVRKFVSAKASTYFVPVTKSFYPIGFFSKKKIGVLASVAGLFISFSFGIWTALNTPKSIADTETPGKVLGAQTELAEKNLLLEGVTLPDMGSAEANNNALFNTPIEYLQGYFDELKAKPDIIVKRAEQIKEFLKEMNSPMEEASETIAKQTHWKLILAIGFAESTMGKNCSDKNCSNIGVAPGHKLWKKYDSYDEWVMDFNGLLERRYKDWTLKEMCGVYVKPCNKNWLLATQQILDALKDKEIE